MDDVDVNDPAVKEAVQQACVEVGLPLAYRSAVSQMLRTPSSEWPACCGEGCFPCQQTLGDAALRALELIGRRPRSEG
ncbi:hypothetical protein JQX13_36740 [Archangium violaceum]|uniref:hypothetical protein n=1 Tax=Archangium violaceum TaxID=83451 RepID=UPI00193B5851|nr:hypothetical protein [Archangium violaceum]QRK05658.1 hypothetical protein JQX13_36740 [Archangium violaceum]